jgi:hypothetical protein
VGALADAWPWVRETWAHVQCGNAEPAWHYWPLDFIYSRSFYQFREMMKGSHPIIHESEAKRLVVRSQPGLHSKALLWENKGWRFGLVVENSCSMCETLGSIPSIAKKNNTSILFFDRGGIWTQGFAHPRQMLFCLSHASSPFCSCSFEYGVLQIICSGWPQTTIILVSTFQISGITG